MLLIRLFIALLVLAPLIALASVVAWLVPVVLVLLVGHRLFEHIQIKRYEADVRAGRVKPTRIDRCQECSDAFLVCDSCIDAYRAANPA
ncbi:hypothetical protein [Streptomyces sp. NPDC058398]|uniref:hypothetical protein n=1 Tax=Streptomyces sp. NPDC058398 TaxID=3346479 RepID=UPI003655171F